MTPAASETSERAPPSSLVRIWRVLRGGAASPARAALSVGIGLFIGCLPLYGLHFFLCALVCLPFGLDLVLAYLAANISNPFVAPVLIAVEIELGSMLLSGHWVHWVSASSGWSAVHQFAKQAGVGGVVVGLTLGVFGGVVAWLVASRRGRAHGSELDLAIERTVARYREAPRGDRIYVSMKLTSDPVNALLAALGPLGDAVDVGAGRGQLGVLLLEAGRIARLEGMDWDGRKVELARAAAKGMNARFDVADIRSAAISEADTVLLIDVLHYLALDEQRALIERAAKSLRTSGRLIVREADRSAGVRARLTVLAERVGKRLGLNRGRQFAFASAAEIANWLEQAGLSIQVQPASEGTPLANVLFVATRQ